MCRYILAHKYATDYTLPIHTVLVDVVAAGHIVKFAGRACGRRFVCSWKVCSSRRHLLTVLTVHLNGRVMSLQLLSCSKLSATSMPCSRSRGSRVRNAAASMVQ